MNCIPFLLDSSVVPVVDKVAHSTFMQECLSSRSHWHKVTIKNGARHSKNELLFAICSFVFPSELFPYKFQVEKENCSFLCRSCAPALRKLCSNLLSVPLLPHYITVELSISVCHVPMMENELSMLKIMKRITAKRYQLCSLNLSRLQEDPALQDVYFNLNLLPMVRLVVTSLPLGMAILDLDLSHNDLNNTRVLASLSSRIKKLTSLDLSHNQLEWTGIEDTHSLKIQNIHLEGNPVCKQSTPNNYIKNAKALFPCLDFLDGVDLRVMSNDPCYMPLKNFLVVRECASMADQLLYHYLGLFTGPDRSHLIRMYDYKATISLTTSIIQPSYSVNGLDEFVGLSRNLVKITDFARVWDKFQSGQDHVKLMLSSLPDLQVDPQSTCVDVPYYEEGKFIMVVALGVMKDASENLFNFDFTFTLKPVVGATGEWKIHNHMIVITNVTLNHVNTAFRTAGGPSGNPFEFSAAEKLEKLGSLTTLNLVWCQRFLEESRWDMEQALQSFVDLYKGRQIPAEAFHQETVTQSSCPPSSP